MDDGTDGEDEETLQLQLQAIEARLKLKRIQQAKAKRGTDAELDSRSTSASVSTATIGASRNERPQLPQQHSGLLQVPLSPTQEKRHVPQSPKSPARVILGIDKGLRAQDVSLRRPPPANSLQKPHRNTGKVDGSRPTFQSRWSQREDTSLERHTTSAKSFSERIAESRLNDRESEQKRLKLEQTRSRGFGIASQKMRESQHGPGKKLSSPDPEPGRQRSRGNRFEDATIGQRGKALGLEKAASMPSIASLATQQNSSRISTKQTRALQSRGDPETSSTSSRTPGANSLSSKVPGEQEGEDASGFESFSGFHLSRRSLNHTFLTRTLEGKELYSLPRLLKTVKSPDYDPPDEEGDYVVFGILAWKSTPYDHKARGNVKSNGASDDNARSKFMVIRLTDLKWEVDLFLFGSGFDQFWKLSIGTVVAVLNPSIMPPKDRDVGAFSLKVCSSEDTVLEIGMARDLGFCKSIKKDGQECRAWIDKRKTEFCEFHVSMQLEKTRAGRMEVNTMASFGGKSSKSGSRGMFGGSKKGFGHGSGSYKGGDDGLRVEGKYFDRSIRETVYIAPPEFSRGRSAAVLLDQEEHSLEVSDRGRTKKDLLRKRASEREKERDLAKKLGEVGSGLGGEYMRQKYSVDESRQFAMLGSDDPFATTKAVDATSLGLLGNKASDVRLNATKRKRSGTISESQPMGWSGAFKRGLLSPTKTQTQRSADSSSPVKKARFMLKQGIREPGRESLGNVVAHSEEEDDLDIV